MSEIPASEALPPETPSPAAPSQQPKKSSPLRLLLIIAVAIIVAVILVRVISGSGEQPAFPQFASSASAVQRIVISGAGDELSLRADAKTWVVDSAGGIRVTDDAVRRFIKGLRGAHIEQDVAATPELISRYKLAQPALRISLHGDGPALTTYALAAAEAGSDTRYALSADGKHILRLRGMPDLSLALDQWISPEVPVMPQARVKSIRRIGQDGEAVLWQRAAKDEPFTADPGTGPAPAFSSLKPDRFVTAKTINWYGATALLYTTFDGVTYTVQVKPDTGGGTWVRFNGDATPDADDTAKDEAARVKQLKAIAFHAPATPQRVSASKSR